MCSERLTDDPGQPRVRAEADALEHILALVDANSVRWITSAAVRAELSRNPNEDKREQSLPLLRFAEEELPWSDAILRRGAALRQQGFASFDALHLAFCLHAGLDYLLTVDDRFLRRASRLAPNQSTQTLNPIHWLARRTA